jgi:hypothetical protein
LSSVKASGSLSSLSFAFSSILLKESYPNPSHGGAYSFNSLGCVEITKIFEALGTQTQVLPNYFYSRPVRSLYKARESTDSNTLP